MGGLTLRWDPFFRLIWDTYSVCSLVVPRLEEAILTPVLKKNFKRPSILGQEGHSYSQKHSNLSYDQFGGGLEQSDTAPLLLPPWLEEY